MSYQVLARKYRPQTFEDVVGQAPIVTTLRNALGQNRLHHAYLFSGLRGVGKTTVARLLAKALNCAKGAVAGPCNACSSCEEIAQSRSLDVLEVDGASNRGIDAVRELRETVRYAPARDRYKVYIIDEVHMLTTEAWNALLKTLEEPPPHVVFIFATTDFRKIPLTILSRCQHFEFKKIGPADMAEHLKKVALGEKAAVPAGVIDLIGRMAEGSLRDAQSALDQVLAFSGPQVTEEQARTILGVIDRELIVGFFDAVKAGDAAALVGLVETVFDRGYPPVQFLEDLMAHGRDLLLARVVADPGRYVSGAAGEIEALRLQAAGFGEDDLLRILELLAREEYRLKNSSHPRFLLEALAIKLARLRDLTPIEELITRLERTPGGPEDAAPAARGPARLAPAPTGPIPPPAARSAAAAPSTPAALTSPAATAPAPAFAAPPPAAPKPVDGAVASPAGGPRDVALVEAILRKVHEERGALGGFLEQAAWVELSGESLEIAFADKQAFFRDKVASRESIDLLRRVAHEVSGHEVQVRVTTATPAAVDGRGPAPADPEAGRKQRLREAAGQEPIVRTLLETFGGEIVDVEGA